MTQETHQPTISPAALFQAAEAVVQSGRQRTVQLHGKTLAIVLRETPRVGGSRSRKPRENAFLAAYRSIPSLPHPLTDNQMTELAAEEAAEAAARAGSEADERS